MGELSAVKTKYQTIVGWGLTIFVSAFLILASAGGKFLEWEGKSEMFGKLGYSTDLMFRIGIVEVVVAVLILIPRTTFLGGLLLTAYLGGAVSTHVRVGDPFIFPIITGIVMWAGIGLRMPAVFALAFRSSRLEASGKRTE